MEKIWLKSYPEGVPAEIDWTQYQSLTHLLEDAFTRHARSRAFACMDKAITYAQLDAMSRKMAAWLQSKGLKQGARVENGHIHMPELPGIGFEGKADLIAVMRDLAE